MAPQGDRPIPNPHPRPSSIACIAPPSSRLPALLSVSTTPAQAESAPAANRAPTVVNAVEPVRPRPLMNFGASGTVEVTFTISAKGTVEKPIGNWIFQGDWIRAGFLVG